MIFPEQRFRLKDGRTCTLRAAQPEDAEAMLDYLRTTAGETPYLLREPEEVTMTIEAERAFLKNSLDDPRALMLTVWVDGQLAGNGSLSPVGSVSRVRHRCSLGIAFYQKYCGLGLGRIVLEALEDAARRMGFGQIELGVFSRNGRAKRLYEKMGFVCCGTTPSAVRYKDGSYDDEIMMVKRLETT